REKINLQDCAEFWFVYEARIPAHIKICAGIRNKVDRTKDKHDVDLFFSGALKLIEVKTLKLLQI
ncbi:MAG: hypothetical protein PVI90_15630, partial [Desulfobacteraceae bacterium]